MKNKLLNIWLIWIVFILLVCMLITLNGHNHTVTTNYRFAALNWFAGNQLYNSLGTGFIYSPQSAILYAPFAYLPLTISETLWRIISIGLFAFALYRLIHFVKISVPIERFFLIMSLLIIPIAYASARNGQMNLLMAAMIMFAYAYIAEQQWWKASFLLILGLALKPIAIPFVLIAAVLYKPLAARCLLFFVLMLLFPFCLAPYPYVMSQYQGFSHMLLAAAGKGSHESTWAQLFGLLAQLNIAIPENIQNLLRCIAALGTLAIAMLIKRYYQPEKAVLLIYAVVACYLMLFNPRTENNNYIILAPAIAYFAVSKWMIFRSWGKSLNFIAMILGLVISHSLSLLLLPGRHGNWFSPLVAIIFTMFLLREILQPVSQQKSESLTVTSI